jgi:hypothetical protein
MAFDRLVGQMAEKWREVLGGDDQQQRRFLTSLFRPRQAVEDPIWRLAPVSPTCDS